MEAKIAPQEIDQLYVGQKATLRFTTFNQRSTSEIEGKVSLISADLTQDQRTGISYTPFVSCLAPKRSHGWARSSLCQACPRTPSCIRACARHFLI